MVEGRGCGGCFGVLLSGAVVYWRAGKWGMLWCCWFGMLELAKRFVHVARHGQMDATFDVVPVECNADVTGAGPIGFDIVVFL